MTFVDVVVLILATWQAVETYRHGSIFASTRAWFEVDEGFLARLTGCPFCLSHWVAMVLVSWYVLSAWAGEWALLIRLPIYALAVTRGAQVMNDVTEPWCRTPDSGEHGFPDSSEEDKSDDNTPAAP